MSVSLTTRRDVTLDAYRLVARDGHGVVLAPEALAVMDSCAASFAALVRERVAADPGALIYGVTTAPGDGAAEALDAERQARRPTRLWTAVSYGDPLPDRVVRGILLARLANLLEGHAGARAKVALAVAAMLDEGPLPVVPAQGNGGAGEILALGSLFVDLSAQLELTPKERMALINGSPCAAALVADVALAGRERIALAERVFALASDAIGAPEDAYCADLETLWGDEHETAALRALRALLAGSPGTRQRHQAPVSFRILPRVLGSARRALAAAERAASISLQSVTDNPVYIPPDAERPLGTVFSTGGYHDARAPAAMDSVAAACADLCQLAERHTDQLFQHPVTAPLLSADEWSVKSLHHAQNWWAEEARSLAQPTLLSLAGFGQNDVPALSFLAWRKATAIGRCLDGALAALAVLASQALHVAGRGAGPQLDAFLAELRAQFPPVSPQSGPLGRDCQALMDCFTRRALGDATAPAR
ncbi:MAG TPA: aromatic amino acid lyase [Solirubrobacteraceae bacterium]|nr:aromatic amino acid lyase [Solirubrobacteraceae bacterium]